jgi:hypothetical protein
LYFQTSFEMGVKFMQKNPHKTQTHSEPVPMVKVSGSHREIGRQIGEAFREKVVHSVENARNLLAEAYEQLELTWDGAKNPIPQVSAVFRGALSAVCG